jgi:hypothetical protein
VEADLDEQSGSQTFTGVIQGSYDGTNYTALDTLTATADETMPFPIQSWDATNGVDYNFMRLKYTLGSTSAKWLVTYVKVKLTPVP